MRRFDPRTFRPRTFRPRTFRPRTFRPRTYFFQNLQIFFKFSKFTDLSKNLKKSQKKIFGTVFFQFFPIFRSFHFEKNSKKYFWDIVWVRNVRGRNVRRYKMSGDEISPGTKCPGTKCPPVRNVQVRNIRRYEMSGDVMSGSRL